MFTTFPTTPRSARDAPLSPRPLGLVSPRPITSPRPQLKREHRIARVYEPKSPTPLPDKPLPAYLPERPAPILSLPGLPDVELPRTPVKQDHHFGHKLFKTGKKWISNIKLPWSPPDPSTPKIPPVSPETAKFVSESIIHTPKDEVYFNNYQHAIAEDAPQYRQDPPPLYTKDPPEGGIVGWMAVAGAFLIQFATIGYIFTWNVFEDHYNHVSLTDQNPMAVRFIGSIQWFLAFFLSLVAGKAADSGYFRHVVVPGSLLFSLCLFLLSIVGEEQFGAVFACQSLGMGIGMGLVFVPTAIVPLHYFKRQRGLAIGIVMSGASFGGTIFPAALRALIPSHGLGGSVRITAIIATVFLVLGNGLIRPIPKPDKPAYPLPHLDLAKYSQELEFIFAAGGFFITMLFIYYPAIYLDLLSQHKGVDARSAFNSVIILSLTGMIGRTAFGFASDIVGPWNLLVPVSGGMVLMLFTMCTVQGIKSLVAFSIFYGFFAGAWLSLMVTAITSLSTRKTEQGTRVGLVFSAGSLPVLFSFLIQDSLVNTRNWVIPSVVAGFLFVAVTGLAFMSRKFVADKKPYRRWRQESIQNVLIV
ncbi:MFS general substrate transporter [Pholiota conissans]|uniref:MFS general substrate transporter n=1 Tax=Pholiota conissans TaxID=109636 RepID=A0A9P5YTW7_9AGAR|nr:MFS general substrate transporter [Pholiota conissans]